MEQNQVFKQMLQLNKLAFDNMYNSIVMFQEQMENMASMVQVPWIPEDGKKAMGEWIRNYKKMREDFKRAMDEGYQKMESYMGAGFQESARQM